MARYIFITGGVVSSLGKGLASRLLGASVAARVYKVRCASSNPYLISIPERLSAVPAPRCVRDRRWRGDSTSTSATTTSASRRPATTADNITPGAIYQTAHQEGAATISGATSR